MALPDVRPAGKLVEVTRDAEFGITHAWLENGIRVHHRHMDYKKDSVLKLLHLLLMLVNKKILKKLKKEQLI